MGGRADCKAVPLSLRSLRYRTTSRAAVCSIAMLRRVDGVGNTAVRTQTVHGFVAIAMTSARPRLNMARARARR